MNLVYADEQGNLYDHPDWIGLGRSGDVVVEIMDEELIPFRRERLSSACRALARSASAPAPGRWKCCPDPIRL